MIKVFIIYQEGKTFLRYVTSNADTIRSFKHERFMMPDDENDKEEGRWLYVYINDNESYFRIKINSYKQRENIPLQLDFLGHTKGLLVGNKNKYGIFENGKIVAETESVGNTTFYTKSGKSFNAEYFETPTSSYYYVCPFFSETLSYMAYPLYFVPK